MTGKIVKTFMNPPLRQKPSPIAPSQINGDDWRESEAQAKSTMEQHAVTNVLLAFRESNDSLMTQVISRNPKNMRVLKKTKKPKPTHASTHKTKNNCRKRIVNMT